VDVAEVRVFVDDAVQGTLPNVCAKDGVATTDRLRFRDELGDRAGLGVAWLLLLLGPLGWLGLVVISVMRSGRSEVLTVELPVSEPAYQRLRAARRLRRNAVVAAVLAGAVCLLALAFRSGSWSPWLVLAMVALAVVVVASVVLLIADSRVRAAVVGLDLDASRRWVTLSRVHPAFAAACQAQQRERQRT
jgi:hypothetical protein